jgi:hypothetical protein
MQRDDDRFRFALLLILGLGKKFPIGKTLLIGRGKGFLAKPWFFVGVID